MEVKFTDVSFFILLKRARRNGVISVGLLTSPAFPSCGQSFKNIFNKYCCCKLYLDQCFLSKWLTWSWNFLYLKHILRQFLDTNCYPFVQDAGCIENLKRRRCWVLYFTWHGQSEWWQCCPFGRRKDGRLDDSEDVQAGPIECPSVEVERAELPEWDGRRVSVPTACPVTWRLALCCIEWENAGNG